MMSYFWSKVLCVLLIQNKELNSHCWFSAHSSNMFKETKILLLLTDLWVIYQMLFTRLKHCVSLNHLMGFQRNLRNYSVCAWVDDAPECYTWRQICETNKLEMMRIERWANLRVFGNSAKQNDHVIHSWVECDCLFLCKHTLRIHVLWMLCVECTKFNVCLKSIIFCFYQIFPFCTIFSAFWRTDRQLLSYNSMLQHVIWFYLYIWFCISRDTQLAFFQNLALCFFCAIPELLNFESYWKIYKWNFN